MKNTKFNKRDIEFLFEIGSLRNVQRSWRQHIGIDSASISEHTLRVIWLALILARKEGVKDEEKIMKMALVHDVPETRTGDLNYIQKVYVTEDEKRAARDALSGTSLEDFFKDTLQEYEKRDSIEAKIVKDADNLEAELEIRELGERGSKMSKKWAAFRKEVRDKKLYTKSAKSLWDAIQDANVADWHLAANKWVKLPDAGK
jgi:putative hydrolase of HD superfamily